MSATYLDPRMEGEIQQQTNLLFDRDYNALAIRTDKLFGGLMIFQWLLAQFHGAYVDAGNIEHVVDCHFDPDVVDAFLCCEPQFNAIRARLQPNF